MSSLSCIIVDDEPLAVRLLESYVEKTPDLELLASFTDSIKAINAIKAQKPDLLFLDIQMPNIDGMELAHSLPEETRVVFTTAFKEYAFESYEVNALDFLLKPIRYNKFLSSVEKARKQHPTPRSSSAFPSRARLPVAFRLLPEGRKNTHHLQKPSSSESTASGGTWLSMRLSTLTA